MPKILLEVPNQCRHSDSMTRTECRHLTTSSLFGSADICQMLKEPIEDVYHPPCHRLDIMAPYQKKREIAELIGKSKQKALNK